jgi:hypothetical protein
VRKCEPVGLDEIAIKSGAENWARVSLAVNSSSIWQSLKLNPYGAALTCSADVKIGIERNDVP